MVLGLPVHSSRAPASGPWLAQFRWPVERWSTLVEGDSKESSQIVVVRKGPRPRYPFQRDATSDLVLHQDPTPGFCRRPVTPSDFLIHRGIDPLIQSAPSCSNHLTMVRSTTLAPNHQHSSGSQTPKDAVTLGSLLFKLQLRPSRTLMQQDRRTKPPALGGTRFYRKWRAFEKDFQPGKPLIECLLQADKWVL